MTYRIPEGHPYHLSEEERVTLEACPFTPVGPTWPALGDMFLRGLVVWVLDREARFRAWYRLTDNGRQALALYDALGG